MRGTGSADLVRAALAAGRPTRLPVTGSGMLPALSDGTVVVEPVEFDQISSGEVVAYQHGERIVVHRVVARRPDHLLTAGDNLPLYDPPVPRTAVLGRVPQVATRVPGVPRAPAVGGRPVLLPDGVTLWLAGAAARAVPETDHHLPVPGSRRPEALVRVRHLAAGSALPDRVRRALDALDALGGVTVGISPAAVRPVDDLRTALAGRSRPARPTRRLDIVLGCRFGDPAGSTDAGPAGRALPWGGTGPVAAPDGVAHHLRAGPPLWETGPASAIRVILATLGVPPLPGFPESALDGAA